VKRLCYARSDDAAFPRIPSDIQFPSIERTRDRDLGNGYAKFDNEEATATEIGDSGWSAPTSTMRRTYIHADAPETSHIPNTATGGSLGTGALLLRDMQGQVLALDYNFVQH